MRRIFLALTTIAMTGWAATTGVAQAAPTPTPSVTAAPTPTPVCPPVTPIGGRVSVATTTSLTIDYFIAVSPPCGYRPPITVRLFTSREDAFAWQNPVAETVSGPERDGSVTFERLTPDTEYWFGFRDSDGRWEPYYGGTGRTAALASCRATATIDSRWGTGFVATVTVRNVGAQPLGRGRADPGGVGWDRRPGRHRRGGAQRPVQRDGGAGRDDDVRAAGDDQHDAGRAHAELHALTGETLRGFGVGQGLRATAP